MLLRRRLAAPTLSLALFLLLTVVATPRLWAGVGFQPVSAEELKMTSEPNAPGAPAIILYRQVDRDDFSDRKHEDNYVRVKILTEEGRKYANLEIRFIKEIETVNGLKARTIRPDGSIVNFEGKVAEQTVVKAKGVKYLAKTLALPDVQVGSIVEYYYTLDFNDRYVYDSSWVLSDELFTKSAHFSLKPWRPYDSRYTMRWSWKFLPSGMQPPQMGHDKTIRMEVHDVPAFQTEDYMPPARELETRVDFIYSMDPPEKDLDKFWKIVGKRMYDGEEAFIDKHGAMVDAVHQIVSPSDDPEVQLQKIYAKVQSLRNLSYEQRRTAQEEKRDKQKNINNVEDVWKRGYGNGYELTWLFLGLVRAAGFDAYGLEISDRRWYFFDKRLMDSNRLNTNAVLVKSGGKDLYFDPGAVLTPYGVLPWSESGVDGMQLTRDGGNWIKTPLPSSGASRVERKALLKLSDTGDLEGTLTVTFTGYEAMTRRLEERLEDDTDRKKYLEDEIKNSVPAATEVELISHPDWISSAPTMTAEFKVKIPGWASSAGRRSLVPMGVFTGAERNLFEHTDRVQPVYFAYPYQKLDDVTIEIPSGWKISSLPATKSMQQPAVGYALQGSNDNGKLRLTRSLHIDILMIPRQYYPGLRDFYQAVRTGDEEQVVLQPGTTTASK